MMRVMSSAWDRAVEREDFPASGLGFEQVGVLCYLPGRFIAERQGKPMGRNASGQGSDVLLRLTLDAGQRVSFLPGLDHADGHAVHIKEVIRLADIQGKLPDGHATAGRNVHLGAVLHDPTAQAELAVNFLTRFILGRHVAYLEKPAMWTL